MASSLMLARAAAFLQGKHQMKFLAAGMQGVAKVEIDRVELHATLGGFEMAFWLQGQTVTPDPNYWSIVHSAEVEVGGSQGQLSRLGVARPAAPLRLQTAPNPLMISWEFRLSITSHQLMAIEDLRDSGDLQIKLVISGEGGPSAYPDRIDRIFEEFSLHVARSTWIARLMTAKALDIALIEIPMPFVDPPVASRDMMEMIRRAQHLFLEGRYPESVARCRTALESMAALENRAENWSSTALDSFKTARRDMTKEQRELAIEAALFHFSHLGAHPNEVQIDRRDAKLVIALTASILAFRVA